MNRCFKLKSFICVSFIVPLFLASCFSDGNSQQSSENSKKDDIVSSRNYYEMETIWDDIDSVEQIIVAVIDSGVDADHEDLQGLVLPGYNAFDDSTDVSDNVGNGTHIAGTIAARINNTIGISGIAGDESFCKILPVKALKLREEGGVGGSDLSISKGIIWAADNGARVINLSFNWKRALPPEQCVEPGEIVKQAIDYAMSKGAIIVASAGVNDRGLANEIFLVAPLWQAESGKVYPGAYPGVITVSGLDRFDSFYLYGLGGDYVDLCAPAEDVYSTVPNDQYGYRDGTGFAVPFVSATVALILCQRPELSRFDVLEILKNSADDYGDSGWDPDYGHGKLNIAQAMNQAAVYDENAYVDNAAPEISLKGSNVTRTLWGEPYDDPGAYAFDEFEGNVVLLTDVSNVNTMLEGEYDVIYSAQDSNGNTATATRKVIVSGLVDLGVIEYESLGAQFYCVWGPLSYPKAISNNGVVVGNASDIMGAKPFKYEDGQRVVLGTLGGIKNSANDINDSGQIVGYSQIENENGYWDYRAFLYEDGEMKNLGSIGDGDSKALMINEGGLIAGTFMNASYDWRAFVYQNGVMSDLGTFGGDEAEPIDINDSGQIIGQADDSWNIPRGFLYQNGQLIDLGTEGNSRPEAINASGKIAGGYYWKEYSWSYGRLRAFTYDGGIITHLGTLGTYSYLKSYAYDINDSGQVVGWAHNNNSEKRAFLYENGQMIDLGTLGPNTNDYEAIAINNNGQIVGTYVIEEYYDEDGNWHGQQERGFVYANEAMWDIGTLGGDETVIRGISDSGVVFGYSEYIDPSPGANESSNHAFLYKIIGSN